MGDALEQLAAQAPTGRPAAPEEIAEAIVFWRPTAPASSRARFCWSMVAEPPYGFRRPQYKRLITRGQAGVLRAVHQTISAFA